MKRIVNVKVHKILEELNGLDREFFTMFKTRIDISRIMKYEFEEIGQEYIRIHNAIKTIEIFGSVGTFNIAFNEKNKECFENTYLVFNDKENFEIAKSYVLNKYKERVEVQKL
jgi:hypothetical protein